MIKNINSYYIKIKIEIIWSPINSQRNFYIICLNISKYKKISINKKNKLK